MIDCLALELLGRRVRYGAQEVSVLGQIRGGKRLDATFNVTMSHVLYNLFTLLLFYPAELFFGVFSSIAVSAALISKSS